MLTETDFHEIRRSRRRRMRGLTLIEALLFLGIAAVVIIGAIAFYQTAQNSSTVNTANAQIQSYVSGIKSLYQTQPSFSSLDNSVVIDTGIAPKNAVRDASTGALVNPWNGTTTITGNNNNFDIEFDGVPPEPCGALVSGGLMNASAIFRITVNSTTFQERDGTPDPAAAAAACNANNNTITIRVR